MPGTNQFLPFAAGAGANTLTPTAYAALTALLSSGFVAGVANSAQFNTALRQATTAAAGLAQFVANQGPNVNDDGSPTNFATAVKSALDALYAPLSGNLTSGSFTGSNQSLASSGYQKLPGGLILQWGRVTGTGTKSFPVTFPNSCFVVICASAAPAGVTSVCHTNGYAITTSQFSYVSENANYSDGMFFAVGN